MPVPFFPRVGGQYGGVVIELEVPGPVKAVACVGIFVDIPGPIGVYMAPEALVFPRSETILVGIPGPNVNPIPIIPPPVVLPPDPGTGIIPTQPPLPAVVWAGGGQSFGVTASRAANDVGSGSASYYGSAPSNGTPLQIIVGGALVQTIEVQVVDDVTIDGSEEQAEFVTASGPGIIDRLRGVLVYPDLGAEHPDNMGAPAQTDRYFDDTASTQPAGFFDGWHSVVDTAPNYGGPRTGAGAQNFTRPTGWPFDGAKRIWDRSAVHAVPIGTVYMRRTFNVPTSAYYNVFAACDDAHETWIDGVKILDRDGFYSGQMEKASLFLDATHSHYISVRATNRGGSAGYLFALMPVSDLSLNGHPIIVSDEGWTCNGYPKTPPGMTAPEILAIVRQEAVTRGAWPSGVSVGGGGTGWPILYAYSVSVGTDYLTLLGQLGASSFDYVPDGGGGIALYRNGYNLGGAGDLGPPMHLESSVDSSNQAASLLVQYDGPGGYVRVGSGHPERALQLSGVLDRAEAIRIGNEVLTTNSSPRTTVTAVGEPLGEGGPRSFGFDIGDTLEGAVVAGINVQEQDDGSCVVTPELVDPLDILEAQNQRVISKYANGNMAGNLAAGQGKPAPTPTQDGAIEIILPPFGTYFELSSLTDPLGPYKPAKPCTIVRFFGQVRDAGVTNTVIRLQVNGEDIAATTLKAGTKIFTHTLGAPAGIYPTDEITYTAVTVGVNGAAGLVIQTEGAVA